MSEDEVAVLAISAITGIVLALYGSVATLHRLFLRSNAAVGLVRLSVLAAMLWIALVIWKFADASVAGVYVVFYLVFGYAAVKLFGQMGVKLFGARLRVDVYERKNLAAAVFIGAFTLATGMIFGGSLWGEADPVGDDEGGWWIPGGFFLLGWTALVAATALFLAREAGQFRVRVRQNRSLDDAFTTAAFLLGSAVLLTDAVAGDFFGWYQGLLSFGGIAAMLILHELLAPRSPYQTISDRRPDRPAGGRVAEMATYAVSALVVWLLTRLLAAYTGILS